MDGNRAGRVLLVEDEHLLRSLIAQFLHGEGFDVVEAADGAQAVELYTTSLPFDVVLLDLNLPILCGVEVCRRIKSIRASQPVIICSAAILDSDIALLQDLHVQRFLSKPYHPMELIRVISSELNCECGAGSIEHTLAACGDPARRRSPFGSAPSPYPGNDIPLGLE